MTGDPVSLLIAAGIIVQFIRGCRSTWALWRVYASDNRIPRSAFLRAFRTISVVVVLAVGWFAVLQVRLLLGYPPIAELRPISGIVAMAVFELPNYCLRIIREIAEGKAGPTG